MTGKRIIFYILAAFIAGNLLVIFIQYNSAKNIRQLVGGNEKLLHELTVKSQLQELEEDILSVENKIRGTVTTSDTSYIEGLETQIARVESDLDRLQKISDDDSSIEYIDQLDHLVRQKLLFNNQIVDSFNVAGKATAEKIIATQRGKRLTDSILQVIQKIITIRQSLLSNITGSLDKSGKDAQRFGTLLIVLVLVTGAALFWYIINIIRNQYQLIDQLHISEKKEREAARVKENFLANMSHEIRTPMNAIIGFTHLLERRPLDTESKEYVGIIQRSGENLLSVINDILDLSKIEAGMMRIETVVFHVEELFQSVESLFSEKAAGKNIMLSSDIAGDVPQVLEGDATHLTQILVNLVGNAIKFTDKGAVRISVSNEGVSDEGVKLGITVSDTGIGIAKDKLTAIFNRFQQAEDSVTRNYGGSGLGLAIVKDLVTLMHGHIEVESEEGKGTSFHLQVPFKLSGETPPALTRISQPKETTYDTFHHVHILVVEDNQVNQSLLQQLFKQWQLSFDLAQNGKEAITLLRARKYDLILMDIQMPVMDGYTATTEIRKVLKIDTPIIAMTAHALSGEREKCLGLGMDEYISKPVREENLLQLIQRFIPVYNPIAAGAVVSRKAPGVYQYINLDYMKEISAGNSEYEKAVTGQFLEAMPVELQDLEQAWRAKNNDALKRVAHNMKTTISVMGLNNLLGADLDLVESLNNGQHIQGETIDTIISVGRMAIVEARHFLASLNDS
jgi:signal transduction histidine kinase/DNA-binding response OmpR family regulator